MGVDFLVYDYLPLGLNTLWGAGRGQKKVRSQDQGIYVGVETDFFQLVFHTPLDMEHLPEGVLIHGTL